VQKAIPSPRARHGLAVAMYYALLPAGLLLRVTRDPLRLRRPRTTNWQSVRQRRVSPARARRLD
jgi:hypothetical protein